MTLKFLDSSIGSAAFDTTVTEARTSNDERSILTLIESMRGPWNTRPRMSARFEKEIVSFLQTGAVIVIF